MKKQQGFTLIELMIVVAIIAILAAIALPMYQDYVAKSQATAGLSEITGGKTAAEVMLNEGKDFAAPADIGLQAVTARCSAITATGTATSGEASISCSLLGNSKINTQTITLTRDGGDDDSEGGTWACTTSVAAKYRPGGCNEAD